MSHKVVPTPTASGTSTLVQLTPSGNPGTKSSNLLTRPNGPHEYDLEVKTNGISIL